MIYKLDESNTDLYNEYRNFVKTTPKGVVTQDPRWANVKSNWDRLFLYHLNSDGGIDGIMSILYIKAVDDGTLAYASKGPLITDISDTELINEFLVKAQEELPDDTFLIRMDPEVIYQDELNDELKSAGFEMRNTQFEHMHSNVQPRKNMIFSFEGMNSIDDIFASYHKDTRKYIRKTTDELITKVGDSEEMMREFYSLHEMMAKHHGITYRPIEYFLEIQKQFKDEGLQIFTTYTKDGIPIESSVGVGMGNKFWLIYAGMNRDYQSMYPAYQNRDFWLKWSFENGYKFADFGGFDSPTPEDGLYVFKKKFLKNQESTIYIGEIDKVINRSNYEIYLKRFDD